MPKAWSPPAIEERGKSKPLPDFLGWAVRAPIDSERARTVVEPLLGSGAEFLQPFTVRGRNYYPINVLATLPNALNLANSDVLFSPDDPRIPINVDRAVFREDLSPVPPMFKLSINSYVCGDVYVADDFATRLRKEGLTGIDFFDPSESAILGSVGNVKAGL